MAVVVDSVDGVSGARPWSHFSKELPIGREAHLNASASVVLIAFVGRDSAACFHVHEGPLLGAMFPRFLRFSLFGMSLTIETIPL